MKNFFKKLIIMIFPFIFGGILLSMGIIGLCYGKSIGLNILLIIIGGILIPSGFLCTLIKKVINTQKEMMDCVKIKTKGCSYILIYLKYKIFKYKKININIHEIIDCNLVNDSKVIYSSGTSEALVGGLLFGGAGAVAGAMIGQREKIKGKFVLYISTTNVKHAGITIKCTKESGFKIIQTIDLLKKSNKVGSI